MYAIRSYYADRATEFRYTLDVALEIVTVKHEKHTSRRRRLIRFADPAVEPTVAEAQVVVAPCLERPAEHSLEKNARARNVGNGNLDIVVV